MIIHKDQQQDIIKLKEGKQDYALHDQMAVHSYLIEKGKGGEKGFKERL
jgi:hypothetical protein